MNWRLWFASAAGSLLICLALFACGSDDKDSDTDTAGDTGGGTASDTGGTEDGTGGTEDGTGGTEDGTGGAAGSEAGAGGGTEDSITAEQKQAVCQCWFDLVDIHEPSLNSECETTVSDSCVKCTERLTEGASCAGKDPSDFSTCLDNCLHLISAPETVDECKGLVEAGTDDPDAVSAGECMCDNCFEDYAPCMANSACLRVILCVAEQGCNGIECLQDPVCSEVIGESLAADPSLQDPLTVDIANCATDFSCLVQSADDADAGNGE